MISFHLVSTWDWPILIIAIVSATVLSFIFEKKENTK
jgi:hypothetical protein